MRHGQTAIVYFVAKSIATGISFLATVYFARILGAEVLGMYALALAVIAWLEIGGKLGLEKAVVKRLSEDNDPGAHLAAGGLLMVGFFVVIAIALWGGREQVAAYVGAPVVSILLFLTAASLFYRLSIAALQGYHYVHVFAILSPARLIAASAIQFGLVLLGAGLVGLLVGYGIGFALAAVAGFVFLRPAVARPGREHISSILTYAKYAWLGSVRTESFRWVDVTVLGFFVSQGLIGVYLVAISVAAFLNTFGEAISTTLFPEISRESTTGNRAAVSSLVEDSLAYGGVFLIPGLVGSLVVGDLLLLIYGAEFVVGHDVLWLLVAGYLGYSYQKQLVNAVNAIDRPDVGFRINAVFIVANVALNVALIAAIGWVGAAIATGLAASVSLAYGVHAARQVMAFEIPVAEIGRQGVASLGMGAAVYAARILGERTVVAEYTVVFALALVGFGALVYFLALVSISDRFRGTVVRNVPLDLPFADR
ncbi:lipopolysaccharide biosynthesis protein [Halovivax gelatinilyticus]|uniref:lipopolysaccharide biosynthesis protein n=1 Tax=Halovivax gelatinilyticus TaxID=2961597 RepID=UPI0020CA563F|nr:oligosaccharide flippase family protein [Halovivax gelatinilyticus]